MSGNFDSVTRRFGKRKFTAWMKLKRDCFCWRSVECGKQIQAYGYQPIESPNFIKPAALGSVQSLEKVREPNNAGSASVGGCICRFHPSQIWNVPRVACCLESQVVDPKLANVRCTVRQ